MVAGSCSRRRRGCCFGWIFFVSVVSIVIDHENINSGGSGGVVSATKWPITLSEEEAHNKKQQLVDSDDNDDDDGIPADFDCLMKKAAYEYGKHLIPRHHGGSKKEEWMDLYYALDLNSNDCQYDFGTEEGGGEGKSDGEGEILGEDQVTMKSTFRTLRSSPRSTTSSSATRDATTANWKEEDYRVIVYVDSTNGIDNEESATDGSYYRSESSPFQSIQVAADYVATILSNVRKELAGSESLQQKQQTQPIRGAIIVGGGDDDTYYLDKTIVLTSRHSGIHFYADHHHNEGGKGNENTAIKLSGGIKLDSSKLKWTRYIQPQNDARKDQTTNIWVTDLSTQSTKIKQSIAKHGFPGLQIIEKKKKETKKRKDKTKMVVDVADDRDGDGDSNSTSSPESLLSFYRATRARYPNLPYGIEVSCGYDCMIQSDIVTWVPPNLYKYGNVTYYTDTTSEHTRNNNGGWFEQYMIGINGNCSVYNPSVSYWCSEKPSGGGAFAYHTPSGIIIPTTTTKSDSNNKGDDEDNYDDVFDGDAVVLPNLKYYNFTRFVRDAIFFIWRPARWANWMFHVDSIKNITTSTTTVRRQMQQQDETSSALNITFGHGGFQGARGATEGGQWFIENLLEELDHPNEYYYDVDTQKLYFFYNDTTKTTTPTGSHGYYDNVTSVEPSPPSIDMEFVIPQQRTILNISGTQWDPIWDVHLSGFTFSSSRYTYMDEHGVPSAGDWALERNGAIFLQGTINTKIHNCIVDRVDGNGIMISGYNRYVTIQDSDFSYVGGTAIASWGYTNETKTDPGRPGVINENWPYAGVDGTDGEHPRETIVTGCIVREVGLYEKQSSFFMQAKTYGTKLIGNVFFNGPRAGINFNDGFGGGDEIAHNLVFSTCRESGDHVPSIHGIVNHSILSASEMIPSNLAWLWIGEISIITFSLTTIPHKKT